MSHTTVACPECSYELKVNPKLNGRKGKCPKCKAIFTVSLPQTFPASEGDDFQRFPKGTARRESDGNADRHGRMSVAIDLSSDVHRLKGRTLSEGAETIRQAMSQSQALSRREKELKQGLADSKARKVKYSWIPLFGYFFKERLDAIQRDIDQASDDLETVQARLMDCIPRLDHALGPRLTAAYAELVDAYARLCRCEYIWDVTSTASINSVAERTQASTVVSRRPVRFSLKQFSSIESNFDAFYWQNANGDDLYLYPGFVLLASNRVEFELFDYSEVRFRNAAVTFIESERIPSDGKQVGQTWAKTNKDGSPDGRFKDNPTIPVMQYGEIEIKLGKNKREVYWFSDSTAASVFADRLSEFLGNGWLTR